MCRIIGFIYGVLSYLVFLASFLYAIGFIGNFFVPRSLDGEVGVGLPMALLVNGALLALFALQHSVMARPAFKRKWVEWVPPLLERSTYVLFSSIALILLFVFWQPLGGSVWEIQNPLFSTGLYIVFALGWLLVLASTFAINHFDLFGLRQSWFYLRGLEYVPLEFKEPLLYRFVRHPLYVGWFIVFWVTPNMSASHLFFAVMTSAYILIAIRFEEKDLCDMHPEYEEYRKTTPMLIPRFKRSQQT